MNTVSNIYEKRIIDVDLQTGFVVHTFFDFSILEKIEIVPGLSLKFIKYYLILLQKEEFISSGNINQMVFKDVIENLAIEVDNFEKELTKPSDNTLYINMREVFKTSNEFVDSKVLDLINRVVGEYTKAYVPQSITDAAYIMQAAQVCYDEATHKEKPGSASKENIENKISKVLLSKNLLEKAFFECLQKEDKRIICLSFSEVDSIVRFSSEPNPEDFCDSVIEKAVRHTLPIPRLKADGVITIKEPTIKIKEEADIEEENIMAQMVESYNYKR
ncbi:hypothetical protein CWI38_0731p0010 [Hamiltosporidium tvaerminnensis]|uniref:Uncharacterized protein n=1 Tax=Hamiltosporidium tvaerminnensis TaxID=1176355 RepID=A0A4Q9LV07_9MICR|nr:hypothetical protein CWI38_0731p0010 [Hamiltosporidium tvaerminnensis]